MAERNIPRYQIFKIGTNQLKYSNWNLNLSKEEAFKFQQIISLFEAQHFRIMANKILKKKKQDIDFSTIFLQIVIDQKSHFNRATCRKGIIFNGINYRRFLGTTGGLKNNTLLFCNSDYIEELNRLCECNRNQNYKLVPAKYEAYKALTCSASQPIIHPEGILVVSDCITQYFSDVISLDDSDASKEPAITMQKKKRLENNVSDGFNLCTIEYMKKISVSLGLDYTPSGVCLRNAWLKGMLYPFPILEFIETYNHGDYFIKDIWGTMQDIRKCEMIITESSLKLWQAYKNIGEYVSSYKECGYEFAVTKIAPRVLDEKRELNYQYLQSYDFTEEDIKELCEPTLQFLKASMCGDYESTVHFLGLTEDHTSMSWQKALLTNSYMLGDPYIIDSVHRLITKKINDAKIGKLLVDGNYQLASGDPFALMQHICGLNVTGLLKEDEIYSKFWIDKNENEVVVFRSPMTCHNNIRKCCVRSSTDCQKWYRYMKTILIINAWDAFCMAENGEDFDSDLNFSTNNRILKLRHQTLPPIECMQRNVPKTLITEKEIKNTNKNGMGNQVGTITNYVTSMMEVQSHFAKGTREYEELQYRISCGQLYQQNELDKLKGIVAKPMPGHWYNLRACKDDTYLQSICADKKPYFMIYVYADVKKQYKDYIKSGDKKCIAQHGCNLHALRSKSTLTEDEEAFLFWYDFKIPVGLGPCAMNKICRYVESELDNYQLQLHKDSKFDYRVLKVKRRCTETHKAQLHELEQYYCECIKEYKSRKKKEDTFEKYYQRMFLQHKFEEDAKELCPNDGERLNIILDLTYERKGNRQFCWDTIGTLIIARLEETNNLVYSE